MDASPDSPNRSAAGSVARRRIRLINADPRFSAISNDLMPEAACGCDSNNPCGTDVPVCVADIPVQGNTVCGIYG